MRQVAPEWTAECNECRRDCPNGPRTDTNDQTLVSPGLTSRIINVGTRTATLVHSSWPSFHPVVVVFVVLPLVLRDLRFPIVLLEMPAIMIARSLRDSPAFEPAFSNDTGITDIVLPSPTACHLDVSV